LPTVGPARRAGRTGYPRCAKWTLVIGSGVTLSGLQFVGSGATLVVGDGGFAVSATLNQSTKEVVLAGGRTSFSFISRFSSDTVSSGGVTISTTVGDDAAQFVLSGGTDHGHDRGSVRAPDRLVGRHRSGTVLNGRTATARRRHGHRNSHRQRGDLTGIAAVESGGVIKNAIVSGGNLQLGAGGKASGSIVRAATCTFPREASAPHVLSAGGVEFVFSAARTAARPSSSGALRNCRQCATASNVVVKSGGELVYAGGTIVNATISSGGKEAVISGVTDERRREVANGRDL